MLDSRGIVGLDEPLGDQFEPELLRRWERIPGLAAIKPRELLSHTSGIKDFINAPTTSLRIDVTEQEVLKSTAPRPLNF